MACGEIVGIFLVFNEESWVRGRVAAWYNRLLFLFSSSLIYPGMFGSAVLFA
jgi:hypothetical protein